MPFEPCKIPIDLKTLSINKLPDINYHQYIQFLKTIDKLIHKNSEYQCYNYLQSDNMIYKNHKNFITHYIFSFGFVIPLQPEKYIS